MIKKFNAENGTQLNIDADARKILGFAGQEYIQIRIEPGMEISPHINQLDVVFYVITGEGMISVEEETVVACRGDLVPVEKGKRRCWKNEGERDLELLVIKSL